MARQSKAQQRKVAQVMHEFKQGELDSSSGDPDRDPKQAIAIALSEAGASREETARGRRSGPGRAELLAEARRRGIAGRSKMSKAELQRALG